MVRLQAIPRRSSRKDRQERKSRPPPTIPHHPSVLGHQHNLKNSKSGAKKAVAPPLAKGRMKEKKCRPERFSQTIIKEYRAIKKGKLQAREARFVRTKEDEAIVERGWLMCEEGCGRKEPFAASFSLYRHLAKIHHLKWAEKRAGNDLNDHEKASRISYQKQIDKYRNLPRDMGYRDAE